MNITQKLLKGYTYEYLFDIIANYIDKHKICPRCFISKDIQEIWNEDVAYDLDGNEIESFNSDFVEYYCDGCGDTFYGWDDPWIQNKNDALHVIIDKLKTTNVLKFAVKYEISRLKVKVVKIQNF